MKTLPIGLQTFEKLRSNNLLYVDKTKYIYDLITNGSVYFFSRPRRFGKSLLLDTIKNLFEGNKSLFEGLYIYDKWDWSNTYPVIHLDFAGIQCTTVEQLEISLDKFLSDLAKEENIELEKSTTLLLGTKFGELIKKLHKKKGKQVVILVDEYDKPLLDNFSNKIMYSKIKSVLHDFYQIIKAKDINEKFVFLTGVSRFAGFSVFSGLNNLNDISVDYKYSAICGYTQKELENNFKEYIEITGKHLGINYDNTVDIIKEWYSGYSWDGEIFVYNPFSILLFFDKMEPRGYWFETGTPTFLIKQVKKNDNLISFIKNRKLKSNSLKGDGSDDVEITALLFQTGYLTIKGKKHEGNGTIQYFLDFPNLEVREAFLNSLIKEYSLKESEKIYEINKKISKALKENNSNSLQKSLAALFVNIPYSLITERESYYSLFLFVARLSGFEVKGEIKTDRGRIEVSLKNGNNIIIVCIKYCKKSVTKMIKKVIKQIKNRECYKDTYDDSINLLAIIFGSKKEITCGFYKL
jgi:hypothetical protein